jgi:gamma-glutamylcyclotransferase (GGCT)/AIG2-like uncharacterized protein YtfP
VETYLFVYGTLLKGQSNHHRLQGSVLVASHAWVHGVLYDVGCGYPALVQGVDDIGRVVGEIYLVSPEVLKSVDVLEGYYGKNDVGNYYDRVITRVNFEESVLEAITYVFSEEQAKSLELIESGDWRRYLTEGY